MDSTAEQRLTAGQTTKFKRLALPHMATLLRISKYLTHHDQQAEDLVQETMMKAMRAIDRFQDGTDTKAWLMTILRHAHIDALRSNHHHARTLSIEQAWITPHDPPEGQNGLHDADWTDPVGLMELFEDRDLIAALKELPDDIRWTLLLVDVEQLDHSAAAEIMEVPVGTVKSRAHRGRAMLRDRLYVRAQDRGWIPNRKSSHA